MKRYISAKERRYYTHMLEIILALGGKDLPYKWLISSIEAYPVKRGKYAAIIQHPLAELEIVAVDSSYAFIVARDAQMAEKFKGLFPKAKENY